MENSLDTEFYVGQIFEDTYPPEAAEFCNKSQKYYISEITEESDTKRKFRIDAIPDPSLEELKNRKLQELKFLFNDKINSNYIISSINGILINANKEAEQNIQNLLYLYENKEDEYAIDFCTYDNTFVSISKEQLKVFYKEVITSLYELRQKKFEIRENIINATSKEELEKIVISFNVSNYSIN